MSVTEVKKVSNIKDDEIELRLGDIVQFFKESLWPVLRWIGAFLIIGVIYAFSLRNEYTSTVKVMPELKSSSSVGGGLNDLKSLAGLAGVNLGSMNNSSEAIRPDLYPDIIQSVPFSLHLLQQPVKTSNESKSQSLEVYLNRLTENNILSKLLGGNENSTSVGVSTGPTIQLTRQQETLSKMINARVNVDMDKKSGIITISAQMPDALISATIARQTLDYLTNYVTSYRTGKARQQVQFLTQQVNNARQRYESAELQLASYRDRNRNLYANTAKIEEQRLQADYMLTQSVYSELSKQLEQARIKVEEEAPVFQILEPPIVPLKKSGPKRTALIAGFMVFGAIIGLAVFSVKRFFFTKG